MKMFLRIMLGVFLSIIGITVFSILSTIDAIKLLGMLLLF